MPASKAQQKAVSKYMKENYDVYQIRMPKGKKATIQAHAEAYSESVNGFINRAIDQTVERDGGGAVVGTPVAARPQEAAPTVGSVLHLPSAVLEDIRRIAEAEGENAVNFVSKAVSAYAMRYDEETAQEDQEGPSEPLAVSLHPEVLDAAQRAAEAARETLPDFVARAVKMQAQMDRGQRERIAAAAATRIRPQPQASFATLPAVGVPVPPDRIEQTAKDNIPGICSLLNQGESRARSKGRSKPSLSAEIALKDLFKAGYTVEEVQGAAEQAAQDGYTDSWVGFPKYCAKLYGRHWKTPR